MKKCPYCKASINDFNSYCPYCEKPLISNLNKRRSESINQIDIESNKTESDFLNVNGNEPEIYDENLGQQYLKRASFYYRKKESLDALKNLNLAIDHFKETNDSLNLAISHNELGLIQEENGYYDDSIFQFEQAIKNFEKINETSKIILAYNNLANVYYIIKDIENSYEFYNKALQLAQQSNLTSEEIKTSSNLVDILFLLKEFNKTEKILNRNLEYFNQINDFYGSIVTLIKLGKLYYKLNSKNYQKSLEKLSKAIEAINKFEKNLSKEVLNQVRWECLFYLGKLHRKIEDFQNSENYFLRSLDAIRLFEDNESLDQAKIQKNLGKLYIDKGDYKNAIEQFNLSCKILHKFGEDFQEARYKFKMAQIYYDQVGNEYEAINLYEESLEIFEDINYTQKSAEILLKLGDIYNNRGNVDLAISNWSQAKEYYEILKDEYKATLITEKIRSLSNT